MYRWQMGSYVFVKHGDIEPEPEPYRPGSVNPRFKVTIHVRDEGGAPLAACKIYVSIATVHQNILAPFKEPKVSEKTVVQVTDANGCAVVDGNASTITLGVFKPGYTNERVILSPCIEQVPDTVNVTMKKAR